MCGGIGSFLSFRPQAYEKRLIYIVWQIFATCICDDLCKSPANVDPNVIYKSTNTRAIYILLQLQPISLFWEYITPLGGFCSDNESPHTSFRFKFGGNQLNYICSIKLSDSISTKRSQPCIWLHQPKSSVLTGLPSQSLRPACLLSKS